MAKQVKIKLFKDGRVVVEGLGDSGGACLQKIEFLDKIFGSPETRELKPEYYETEDGITLSDSVPSGWCG